MRTGGMSFPNTNGLRHLQRDRREREKPLQDDPLDLVESDFVSGAVVELRGPRARMAGDRLGGLERTAGSDVGSDYKALAQQSPHRGLGELAPFSTGHLGMTTRRSTTPWLHGV